MTMRSQTGLYVPSVFGRYLRRTVPSDLSVSMTEAFDLYQSGAA